MAKVELKGTIIELNAPEKIGEKQTLKQTMVFLVAGYVDEFGDKKSLDEEWPIDIMGARVEQIGLKEEHIGKRAKAIVYINSSTFTRKTDGTTGRMINASLAQIQIVGTAPAAATQAEKTNSTW
jgi:hypothetical protein